MFAGSHWRGGSLRAGTCGRVAARDDYGTSVKSMWNLRGRRESVIQARSEVFKRRPPGPVSRWDGCARTVSNAGFRACGARPRIAITTVPVAS
jgi:hypothetical protein